MLPRWYLSPPTAVEWRIEVLEEKHELQTQRSHVGGGDFMAKIGALSIFFLQTLRTRLSPVLTVQWFR